MHKNEINAEASPTGSGIRPPAGKDIAVLGEFISIYCGQKHPFAIKKLVRTCGGIAPYINDLDLQLCASCARLMLYSASMRVLCPYDPKPSCKKCRTHCYRSDYRSRIREVMRFSGMYVIKHGRFGLITKYLF
jgi:hypothetical protein